MSTPRTRVRFDSGKDQNKDAEKTVREFADACAVFVGNGNGHANGNGHDPDAQAILLLDARYGSPMIPSSWAYALGLSPKDVPGGLNVQRIVENMGREGRHLFREWLKRSVREKKSDIRLPKGIPLPGMIRLEQTV